MSRIEWSQLFKNRQKIRERYPSIWKLPIAPRYSDVLFREAVNPVRLLEIGAGDRDLKNKIQKNWPDCLYFSFDIDPNGGHDFSELEDISGTYDMVCMFEVIEHVSPALALATLKKCYDVLDPGGMLLVSTPNIYYPPGFLRDATHVTPWCYDELGGIVSLAGFEVKKIFRLYKESLMERLVKRYLFYAVFRILGIDFARQIMLMAVKK